jgi:hypothetical protein
MIRITIHSLRRQDLHTILPHRHRIISHHHPRQTKRAHLNLLPPQLRRDSIKIEIEILGDKGADIGVFVVADEVRGVVGG